jgi:hypothetical protein
MFTKTRHFRLASFALALMLFITGFPTTAHAVEESPKSRAGIETFYVGPILLLLY